LLMTMLTITHLSRLARPAESQSIRSTRTSSQVRSSIHATEADPRLAEEGVAEPDRASRLLDGRAR
jgi:hypothetical protein